MRAHQNPFRSSCLEALRFIGPGGGVAALLAQLDRCNGRGALVGPQGSGKTTLLLELAEAMTARGLAPRVVRLRVDARRPDWRALRGLTAQSPLLLDGAEQLGLLSWWRVRWLARHAPYLVTTSHTRAHLPLLHRHDTSPSLLRDLVARLLAQEPAATIPPPSSEALQALFAQCGGNLRACFRELYDLYGTPARGASVIRCNRSRSQVGQAFLPDPVGQECPTYLGALLPYTKSQMRPPAPGQTDAY
jgi:energy-coupling factor transporter ATP-binding protein EcfA2